MYQTPQEIKTNQQPIQSTISFHQPNINISNTIYNLPNPNYPYQNGNPFQMQNNLYNGMNNMQIKDNNMNYGYGGMNNMQMKDNNMNYGYGGMNNMQMNNVQFGMNNNMLFQSQKPNNNSFNDNQNDLKKFNSIQPTNSTNVDFNLGGSFKQQNSGFNLGTPNSSTSTTKKEKKDPFENLVSFK